MFKFIKTANPEDAYDRTEVEIKFMDDDADLDTLLSAIEDFLRACGYLVNELIDADDEPDINKIED